MNGEIALGMNNQRLSSEGVGRVHSSEETSNDRGAKGPCYKGCFNNRGESRLETTTDQRGIPEKLAQLRAKLNQKAKQEPKFRFYTLYGHLTKDDVLEAAWKQVKRNGGGAGIDRITIQGVETSKGGVKAFLEEIKSALVLHTYRPSPLKRVYIPKNDGRMRPLGIPTIRDRVIQAALQLIIEPIFEADFQECSHGFRPDRSAHDGIEEIRMQIQRGKQQVYDADLKSYFDTIPHDKLMKAVEARISDTRILRLIRMWLTAPVWEPGKPMQGTKSGTPQVRCRRTMKAARAA